MKQAWILAATLAAAAAATAAVPGARADGPLPLVINTAELIEIVKAKILTQQAQTDAIRLLDGATDAEARRAAQTAIDNLNRAFDLLERRVAAG